MYARMTPFKLKPDSRDEAVKIMSGLKNEILGLEGMKHFVCATDNSGSGYVVSLVDSKEASDANTLRVKEIWSNFAGMLEQSPTPAGYEVLAAWTPEPA